MNGNLNKTEQQPLVPKFAVYLAYAYLFVYYTRLQDNIPGLSAIPWVGALFLLFTLWGIFAIFTYKGNFFKQPIGLVFLLGVLFGLSGIGAISVVSYKMSLDWIFQTFPQCVALVVVFSSLARLKALHNFWCLIYCAVAILTIKNAPSGPGDFVSDPNDVCLALGMGIPFVFYAIQQTNLTARRRLFLYAVLLLLFVAIVATSSRGGFLGMIAGLLAIWWMSKSRVKIMSYSIVSVLIAGSLFLSFLPERYVEDMSSISDTGDSTRIERFRTWEIAWEMFKSNPVMGVGAGNFSNTVHVYQHKTSWWTGEQKSLSGRSTHSLHFQVLSEIGIIGVLIYVYVMVFAPLRLLRIIKQLDPSNPDELQIRLFCQALIASMAVYAIAGAFISVAYYPHVPIWLSMYTIILVVLRTNYNERFFPSGTK